MQPPSLHSNFFSSLKQVEKRLKLDNSPQHAKSTSLQQQEPPVATQTNCTSTESLSTPIYVHTCSTTFHDDESSVAPHVFLSSSQSSLSQQHTFQETTFHDTKHIREAKSDDVDDVQHLMQLLGLSEGNKDGIFGGDGGGDGGEFCGCESGFYEKIVGVKGPKCKKEVERLEGWIKYFLEDEERKEPLRLAILLLGKAAFKLEGGDGSSGLEFPSTIEEFLKFDPPSDESRPQGFE